MCARTRDEVDTARVGLDQESRCAVTKANGLVRTSGPRGCQAAFTSSTKPMTAFQSRSA